MDIYSVRQNRSIMYQHFAFLVSRLGWRLVVLSIPHMTGLAQSCPGDSTMVADQLILWNHNRAATDAFNDDFMDIMTM
jgi:hypothetical protein